MNKQLLAAALIAISGLAQAETQNYDFMPIDFAQFCTQNNTEDCKAYATLWVAAQALADENSGIIFTQEQAEERDRLHAAIAQAIQQTREVGIKATEDSNTTTTTNTDVEKETTDNILNETPSHDGLAEELNAANQE